VRLGIATEQYPPLAIFGSLPFGHYGWPKLHTERVWGRGPVLGTISKPLRCGADRLAEYYGIFDYYRDSSRSGSHDTVAVWGPLAERWGLSELSLEQEVVPGLVEVEVAVPCPHRP
jgi:hypothetical protein